MRSRATSTGITVWIVMLVLLSACSGQPGDQHPGGNPATSSPPGTPASPTPSASATDQFVMQPGRLGDLKIGAKATDPLVRTLVRKSTGICGEYWMSGRVLADAGIQVEFRWGDRDKLDGIHARSDEGAPSPVVTPEGARVGMTEAALVGMYGKRLHKKFFPGEGGGYDAQVLFGPDGALVFALGNYLDGKEVPEPVVGVMSAVAGTNMKNVDAPLFGC